MILTKAKNSFGNDIAFIAPSTTDLSSRGQLEDYDTVEPEIYFNKSVFDKIPEILPDAPGTTKWKEFRPGDLVLYTLNKKFNTATTVKIFTTNTPPQGNLGLSDLILKTTVQLRATLSCFTLEANAVRVVITNSIQRETLLQYNIDVKQLSPQELDHLRKMEKTYGSFTAPTIISLAYSPVDKAFMPINIRLAPEAFKMQPSPPSGAAQLSFHWLKDAEFRKHLRDKYNFQLLLGTPSSLPKPHHLPLITSDSLSYLSAAKGFKPSDPFPIHQLHNIVELHNAGIDAKTKALLPELNKRTTSATGAQAPPKVLLTPPPHGKAIQTAKKQAAKWLEYCSKVGWDAEIGILLPGSLNLTHDNFAGLFADILRNASFNPWSTTFTLFPNAKYHLHSPQSPTYSFRSPPLPILVQMRAKRRKPGPLPFLADNFTPVTLASPLTVEQKQKIAKVTSAGAPQVTTLLISWPSTMPRIGDWFALLSQYGSYCSARSFLPRHDAARFILHDPDLMDTFINTMMDSSWGTAIQVAPLAAFLGSDPTEAKHQMNLQVKPGTNLELLRLLLRPIWWMPTSPYQVRFRSHLTLEDMVTRLNNANKAMRTKTFNGPRIWRLWSDGNYGLDPNHPCKGHNFLDTGPIPPGPTNSNSTTSFINTDPTGLLIGFPALMAASAIEDIVRIIYPTAMDIQVRRTPDESGARITFQNLEALSTFLNSIGIHDTETGYTLAALNDNPDWGDPVDLGPPADDPNATTPMDHDGHAPMDTTDPQVTPSTVLSKLMEEDEHPPGISTSTLASLHILKPLLQADEKANLLPKVLLPLFMNADLESTPNNKATPKVTTSLCSTVTADVSQTSHNTKHSGPPPSSKPTQERSNASPSKKVTSTSHVHPRSPRHNHDDSEGSQANDTDSNTPDTQPYSDASNASPSKKVTSTSHVHPRSPRHNHDDSEGSQANGTDSNTSDTQPYSDGAWGNISENECSPFDLSDANPYSILEAYTDADEESDSHTGPTATPLIDLSKLPASPIASTQRNPSQSPLPPDGTPSAKVPENEQSQNSLGLLAYQPLPKRKPRKSAQNHGAQQGKLENEVTANIPKSSVSTISSTVYPTPDQKTPISHTHSQRPPINHSQPSLRKGPCLPNVSVLPASLVSNELTQELQARTLHPEDGHKAQSQVAHLVEQTPSPNHLNPASTTSLRSPPTHSSPSHSTTPNPMETPTKPSLFQTLTQQGLYPIPQPLRAREAGGTAAEWRRIPHKPTFLKPAELEQVWTSDVNARVCFTDHDGNCAASSVLKAMNKKARPKQIKQLNLRALEWIEAHSLSLGTLDPGLSTAHILNLVKQGRKKPSQIWRLETKEGNEIASFGFLLLLGLSAVVQRPLLIHHPVFRYASNQVLLIDGIPSPTPLKDRTTTITHSLIPTSPHDPPIELAHFCNHFSPLRPAQEPKDTPIPPASPGLSENSNRKSTRASRPPARLQMTQAWGAQAQEQRALLEQASLRKNDPFRQVARLPDRTHSGPARKRTKSRTATAQSPLTDGPYHSPESDSGQAT